MFHCMAGGGRFANLGIDRHMEVEVGNGSADFARDGRIGHILSAMGEVEIAHDCCKFLYLIL